MNRFTIELELPEALALWLALRDRERDDTVAGLVAGLRSYLYDRLSIDEMEHPEQTWSLLQGRASARGGRP